MREVIADVADELMAHVFTATVAIAISRPTNASKGAVCLAAGYWVTRAVLNTISLLRRRDGR